VSKPSPVPGTAAELRELIREAHAATKDLEHQLRTARGLVADELPDMCHTLMERQLDAWREAFARVIKDGEAALIQRCDDLYEETREAMAVMTGFDSHQAMLDHLMGKVREAVDDVLRGLIRDYEMDPAAAIVKVSRADALRLYSRRRDNTPSVTPRQPGPDQILIQGSSEGWNRR
jgi:hypothetical protein